MNQRLIENVSNWLPEPSEPRLSADRLTLQIVLLPQFRARYSHAELNDIFRERPRQAFVYEWNGSKVRCLPSWDPSDFRTVQGRQPPPKSRFPSILKEFSKG